MAHDYEDLHDIDGLSDEELRDLVREQLDEHPSLDIGGVVVHAKNGRVTLSGSVATDEERRIATHVLTDVLGVEHFVINLAVDPMGAEGRGSSSEEEIDTEVGRSLDAEVAIDGVVDDRARQVAADLDGTSDYESVMEDGATWNPPDAPTPEGMRGTDAGPEDLGGRH